MRRWEWQYLIALAVVFTVVTDGRAEDIASLLGQSDAAFREYPINLCGSDNEAAEAVSDAPDASLCCAATGETSPWAAAAVRSTKVLQTAGFISLVLSARRSPRFKVVG